MNVVKLGKERIFRITCRRCRSILEYTTSDVRRSPIVWPDGGVSGFSVQVVSCPVCGEDVTI